MRGGWIVAGLALMSANASAKQQNPTPEQLAATLTDDHFALTSTIKDDSLEVVARVTTEKGYQEKEKMSGLVVNDSFLIAYIDKKTGLTEYRLYHYIRYNRGWRFYYQVNYETPNGPESKEVDSIARDVLGCSQYGCRYAEHFAFDVAPELLKSIAAGYEAGRLNGWNMKFKAKDGSELPEIILAAEAAGLLKAVSDFKAKQGIADQ